MIAALATIAFLATLWLLTLVAAAALQESGARIAAALKGQAEPRSRPLFAPARVRARTRFREPMRARPRWRDAA
jgi:predicted deacetylase